MRRMRVAGAAIKEYGPTPFSREYIDEFEVPADHLARQSPRHIDRRCRARRHVAAAAAARAPSQWPTRPVKLVVPFAAGGTTDILARVVAAKSRKNTASNSSSRTRPAPAATSRPIIVAKAEPDGYTFVVGTPGTHAINQFVFKNMTYDQAKDIAPVIIIARVPNLCSVTNSLPVKSVAELIAYAKSKPGELFYGTPGLGSTAHVSTELFKSMTGVEMTHVPYKGSAPALTDLIAGRVHLMIDNLPAAQSFAESARSARWRSRQQRAGRDCPISRLSPKPAYPVTRRHHGSRSARRQKRRRRSSKSSTPAWTSFSRPRTASRDCANSAPNPRAVRPPTCKPMCWPKPRSGKVRQIRRHQAGLSATATIAYGADQIYSVGAVHHAVELEPFPLRGN